jgi:hypothetical protein
MPVTVTSRYYGSSVHDVDDPDRGRVPTVAIRLPTSLRPNTRLIQHVVTGVEDIEYLAWRYYGASDAWWRIAEANPMIFPFDLRPGTAIVIPASDDLGRIQRRRNF